MNSLAQAVYSAVAAALPECGEPEWDLAPESKAFPFVVLSELPTMGEDVDTGLAALSERQILATVYAKSKHQANELRDRLHIGQNRLVGVTMTLDGGHMIQCNCAGDTSGLDPDRDEAGEEVWASSILLSFLVERALDGT